MLDNSSYDEIFKIIPIPLFEDNYSYLIYINSEVGVLVDPADSNVIKSFLSNYPSMVISHILITHKHFDHAGGVIELLKYFQQKNQIVEVVAGEEENLSYVTIPVKGEMQIVTIFNTIPVKCYKVPCHTKGHLLYHFIINSEKFKNDLSNQSCFKCNNCLFTGDTLFIGGCGKFFEGNAYEMHKNFQLIKTLPLNTQIFCGHEYTVSNLEWALGIEWENEKIIRKLANAKELVSKGNYTIPSSISEELDTNVFLRYDSKIIIDRLNLQDEVQIIEKLRDLKNKKISLKCNL